MLFPERCSGMVIFHCSPFRARREGGETRRMRRRQMYYAIRVQGHLGPSWQDRFGGLCIEQQETGTTLLSGTLHGVLLQIIRLGLVLLSLETSEAPGGAKAAEHA